jgi:hypothetical protein
MTAQDNPDAPLCSNLETTTNSPLTIALSRETPHKHVDMDYEDNEGVRPATEVHEHMDANRNKNSEAGIDDEGVPPHSPTGPRVWCTRLLKEPL